MGPPQLRGTPLALRQQWPKLSEKPGPRNPGACQRCGCSSENDQGIELCRWEECDEWDKPTGVLVVLCKRCEAIEIERHPRLYRSVDHWQPWPGAMEICVDCKHRDGLVCDNPRQSKLGGEGLAIHFPKPLLAHVCRSPRSTSGYVTLYQGPPKSCDGREARE